MGNNFTVSIIVAAAQNNAIGRGNDLIWHIGEDLRFFKATTTGHPIIMGRRTFESIGRALPGRLNIVVSGGNPVLPEGVVLAHSLGEAINAAASADAGEIFITGGGRIYAQALDFADRIYLTRVFCSPEDADTFFPALEPSIWIMEQGGEIKTDEKSGLQYRFETWRRTAPRKK